MSEEQVRVCRCGEEYHWYSMQDCRDPGPVTGFSLRIAGEDKDAKFCIGCGTELSIRTTTEKEDEPVAYG